MDDSEMAPEVAPSQEEVQVEEQPLEVPAEPEMSDPSSFQPTPTGSPLASDNGIPSQGKPIIPGIYEDFSRAGRKRKVNSKYLDEPSPVSKPVVRRASVAKKAAPAPPSPRNGKRSITLKGPTTSEPSVVETSSLPAVTGPPTFGSILFGHKSHRKMSDSISESAFLDEEIPDIVSEDEEPHPKAAALAPVVEEKLTAAAPSTPFEPKKLEGTYIPTGAVGDTTHGMIKAVLVPPSDGCGIALPDLTSEEYLGSLGPTVPVMAELGGGGILSLIPGAPIYWLRDEVPKLSAYFKKKLEGGPTAPRSSTEPKKPAAAATTSGGITEAQRAERRRQKEEERRRLIEERNRRKERERLKLLYRQHWLALTKFPIEDDLLHSHKGIRRLGHPPIQCRQVAPPVIFWDCRLGAPGTLEVPEHIGGETTELLDELFVVWNFFNQFNLAGVKFTLPELVEGIMKKDLTPIITRIYSGLVHILRPWMEFQITALLQAEQSLESQLTKNRGRAKQFWSSICQFRDFLFLGYCVFVNKVAEGGACNWLWLSLYIAKSIVLFESIDHKTKEFLNTIATAFEEIDFEHRWIFDQELDCIDYASIPFRNRVKLLKLLVDKVVSLPVIKRTVDVCCEGKSHILAEIGSIEKEERKMSQRITLCQKLQSILDSAPDGLDTSSIQLPMAPEELARDVATRDLMIRARKIASLFSDIELSVRLESIGRDRNMNEYFQVSSLRRIVFVRQRSVSHPNVVRYGVYDSLSNIESLIQSLDDRGVREQGLKAELQKIKAYVYSEMMAKGENDFEEPSVGWLGSSDALPLSIETDQLETDLEQCPQIKYLVDCVTLSKNGVSSIRDAWFGKGAKRVPPSYDEDDDDVTVDEGMMDDEEEEEEEEDSIDSISLAIPAKFLNERESLYESIMTLANTLSSGFKNSLLAFPKIGETPSTSSSVLVQFHIKSGADLLRQFSIPTDIHEFNRLVSSIKDKPVTSVTSIILDGLLGLDEVVHDELARHGGDIEFWHSTGGEKHAWKSFLGADQVPLPSPGEEESESPEETNAAITEKGAFSCEGCGKQCKYHILLGVHKLHPCKTRGRKPVPVDPVMEVFPVSDNNGVLAIERVEIPTFPQLPSTRQEAAEKAEKAAAAAAAVSVAPQSAESISEQPAVVPGGEYICDICGKSFPHNQGLAVHQTRWCIPEQQAQLIITAQQAVGGMPSNGPSEPQGSVSCDGCGKIFPTSQGLAIHQTRWCKVVDKINITDQKSATIKTDEDVKKTPRILHTDPLYVQETVQSGDLVKIEEISEEKTSLDEPETRQPGYTPACFSLAAVSVAILWYNTRFQKTLDKFTSEKVHQSRTGGSKKSNKK